MFLETERLILRKFEEQDFEDYCEYAIDSEMAKMMGRADFQTKEEARLNFDWLKNKEPRGYVLVLKESGKVIGNFTVYDRGADEEHYPQLCGKVGKALSFCVARQHQRKGLIYEACRHVIEHLFRQEGCDYIYCGHFDFNMPSRELQHKLGFRYLGENQFDIDGVTLTEIDNILYKENWK